MTRSAEEAEAFADWCVENGFERPQIRIIECPLSNNEASELLLEAGVDSEYLDANPEAVKYASAMLAAIQKRIAEKLAERLIEKLFSDERFAAIIPR
jgi:hypothetical protein